MWWFHLLIRRVETLQKRVQMLERVVLAVGAFRYAERGEILLVQYVLPHDYYYGKSVRRCTVSLAQAMSPGDMPAILYSNGSLEWRGNGRQAGKPFLVSIDGHVSYESYHLDGSRGDMSFTFHKTPHETYQLLREGFK